MFTKTKQIAARFMSLWLVLVFVFSIALSAFVTGPALAVDPTNADATDPISSTSFKIDKVAGQKNLWKATYTITPKVDQIPPSSDIVVILDYSYAMKDSKDADGKTRLDIAIEGIKGLANDLVKNQEGTTNRMAVILQGGNTTYSKVLVPMTDDADEIINTIDANTNMMKNAQTGQDYVSAINLMKDMLETEANNPMNENAKQTVLWMSAGREDLKPSNFSTAMSNLKTFADETKTAGDVEFELYALGIGEHDPTIQEDIVKAAGGDPSKNYYKCAKESDFAPLIDQFGKAVLNTVQNANASFNVNAPFYIIDTTADEYFPTPVGIATVETPAPGRKIEFKNINVAKPTAEKPSTILEFYVRVDYNGGGGSGGTFPELVIDGEFSYDKNKGNGQGTDKPGDKTPVTPEVSDYDVKFITEDKTKGNLKASDGSTVTSVTGLKKTAKTTLTASEIPGTLPASSKYEFVGWKIEGDTTGTIIPAADMTKQSIEKSVTYIAVFDTIKLNVTFDLNGGSINSNTANIVGKVGQGDTISTNATFAALVDPTPPANQKFTGWKITAPTATTAIYTTAKVKTHPVSKDGLVYTAQYEQLTASVTYGVKTSGSATLGGTTSYPSVDYGKALSVVAPVPAVSPTAGYTFNDQWEVTVSNGAVETWTTSKLNAYIVNGTPIKANAILSKNQIKVTFDATSNGKFTNGTTSRNESIEYGNKVSSVEEPVPSDPSLKFVGWKEGTSSYTSTAIKNETITSSRTFIAQYETRDITVKYESADTTMGTATGQETVTYGNKPASVPTPAAKAGFTFDHWELDGNTVVPSTYDVKPAVGTDTITFKAVFKGQTFDVEFDAATDGKFTNNTTKRNETVAYGKTVSSVEDPVPNDPSKKFVGWKEGTTPYTSTAIKNEAIKGKRTFVAQYETRNITVKYESANTTMGTVSGQETVTYGNKPVSVPTPVAQAGFTFDHWELDGNTVVPSTYDVKPAVGTDTITFKAVFKGQTLKITFDATANGTLKTGMNSSQELAYKGKATNIDDAIPNTPDKVFDGWFVKQTNQTLTTDGVKGLEVKQNLDLVAVYKDKSARITYSVNDPSMGSLTGTTDFSTNVVYNKTVKAQTTVPTPNANPSYKFVQWTIDGTPVDLNTYVVNKDQVNVVAVFALDKVAVTYDANGGTLTGQATEQVTIGGKPANVPTATNPGNVFTHWVKVGDEGTPLTDAQVRATTINEPTTFKAIYEVDTNNDGIPDKYQYTYTINFKGGSSDFAFDGAPSSSFVVLGGDSRVNNTSVLLGSGYRVPAVTKGGAAITPKWVSNPATAGGDPTAWNASTTLTPGMANPSGERSYTIDFTVSQVFNVTFQQANGTKIGSSYTIDAGQLMDASTVTNYENQVNASRAKPFQGWTSTDPDLAIYLDGNGVIASTDIAQLPVTGNWQLTAKVGASGSSGGRGAR